MYPELLPHQLRPISTYPNPPISHIGKNRKLHMFCCFPDYSLQDREWTDLTHSDNANCQTLMIKLFNTLKAAEALLLFRQLIRVILLIFDIKSVPTIQQKIQNKIPSEYTDITSFKDVDMEELMQQYE